MARKIKIRKRPNFLKRSITRILGTFDDPEVAKKLYLPNSNHKITVTEKNVLQIPAFDRAISLIADQIASLPFSVYKKLNNGAIEEQYTHPLYKLLNFQPSPLYNSFAFRENLIKRLYLKGEVLIKIIKNGGGQIVEFRIIDKPFDRFVEGDLLFYSVWGEDKVLRYDEVIHLHYKSINGLTGESLIKQHNETLGRALSEIYFASAYYGNGAHLSGIVKSTKKLTNEQRDEIEERFMAKYGGSGNFGRVIALGLDFDFKQTGNEHTATDLEARRLTNEDIANITGVPPFLLSNLTKSTFSNNEQLARAFVQYTLAAHCERIESEFNAKCFSSREIGRTFVRFDLDGLLRGDTEARVKYWRELYNIRSVNPNEVRLKENIGMPYQGGDEFGMPLASNSKEKENTNGGD